MQKMLRVHSQKLSPTFVKNDFFVFGVVSMAVYVFHLTKLFKKCAVAWVFPKIVRQVLKQCSQLPFFLTHQYPTWKFYLNCSTFWLRR